MTDSFCLLSVFLFYGQKAGHKRDQENLPEDQQPGIRFAQAKGEDKPGLQGLGVDEEEGEVMPKYKLSTERIKANQVAKTLLKNDVNAAEVARQKGTTRQNESQKLRRKPVRDALTRYLESSKTIKKVKQRLDEGLDANKVIGYLNNKIDGVQKVSDEFVEVPDKHCRHKYLVTYLQVTGRLKNNGSGKGNQVVVINYGYRKSIENVKKTFI